MTGTEANLQLPATCPTCGYDLSSHLESAGEESFLCSECGKALSLSALIEHQRAQHDALRMGVIWWMLALLPVVFARAPFYLEHSFSWVVPPMYELAVFPGGGMLLLALAFYATWHTRTRSGRFVLAIFIFFALVTLNCTVLVFESFLH